MRNFIYSCEHNKIIRVVYSERPRIWTNLGEGSEILNTLCPAITNGSGRSSIVNDTDGTENSGKIRDNYRRLEFSRTVQLGGQLRMIRSGQTTLVSAGATVRELLRTDLKAGEMHRLARNYGRGAPRPVELIHSKPRWACSSHPSRSTDVSLRRPEVALKGRLAPVLLRAAMLAF